MDNERLYLLAFLAVLGLLILTKAVQIILGNVEAAVVRAPFKWLAAAAAIAFVVGFGLGVWL